MSATLDKRNPNFHEVKVEKPDERIEYWQGNNYKGMYEALKFCEFIPADTAEGKENEALRKATGSEEPRVGIADRATEERFQKAMEAFFSLRAMTKEKEARQDLRAEFKKEREEHLVQHPEEIWSTGERERGIIQDSMNIDQEQFRFLDLKAALASCFDAKYRAGLEESNRNLRMYEEKSAEVTFRTTERKIQDFLEDEWRL